MAVDPSNVQMQALRMKNAGDPRPLPEIIQTLMASSDAAPPAPVEAPTATVEPTPAQPVPVGQPVDVRVAVPPMATPFSPVDKARAAAAPAAAQPAAPAATVSATDAAVKNAADKRDPVAAALAQQEDRMRVARQTEMDAIAKIREDTGVDRRYEEFFKKREERYAQREAELAADQKKQAWDALAMAGFKMAQSTSPYFAAALAEGLQTGLEGYNSAKASAAEKKARLEDARDSVALDRIASEDRAEARALSDRAAGEEAGIRDLETRAKALQLAITETREPLMRQKLQLELASIQQSMDLARQANARAWGSYNRAAAGDSGSGALLKAYTSGIAGEAEYGRKFAEGAMEGSDLRPGDPGYATAFQSAVAEGRSIFRNSNPQWMGVANKVEGVQSLERPKNAPAQAAPKKEESWWDRIFG